jgi:hypothetical protein
MHPPLPLKPLVRQIRPGTFRYKKPQKASGRIMSKTAITSGPHLTKPRMAASVILVLGWVLMLALNAPGQMSYDSVTQLADGRSGHYNSWHPPVMSWLLGLFDAALPGTLLFLIFQSALLLLALLALLRLMPRTTWWTAAIVILIVLTPQWLLYQGEIWKDILFADAAIAGFVALALSVREARVSKAWLGIAALLLGLAACTRQNGVVLLPVAAVAFGFARRGKSHGWLCAGGFFAATLTLSIAATALLTARGDGGAGASAEIRLAQSYDLAGALAHDGTLALPQLAAMDGKLENLLRDRGAQLYSPARNDPFAADPQISQAIANAPSGAIAGEWQALVLHHPALYLHTRLAVFAQVLRTPDAFVCHLAYSGVDGPPDLLRRLGLRGGSRAQDQSLAAYARLFFGTPVFSHLAWGAAALFLIVLLWRRGGETDRVMAGLLVGAILFTMTFVIISIACDYRYLLFLDLTVMAAALYASAPKDR